jgi:hypothetical protein
MAGAVRQDERGTRARPTLRHHYLDEAYAFFQNSHHLKDWLKNDPSAASAVGDVEQAISASPWLSLCADLANGSKHLTLTRARADPATKIGSKRFALNLGGGPPFISAKYEVHSQGQTFDAFTVATECVREWEAYLKAKGLL